ncbi:MAG: hypothetical protein WAL90_09235 [Desulfobacterales bacterium]
MENETPEDQFSEEVEDRLENLFGDEDPTEVADIDSAEIVPHPLRDLKTILLSIDWEITDEVMTSFVEQVDVLQDRHGDDRIVLAFLQLLGSIGEYIRTHLGKSHPDAFKLLNSLFTELEKIVRSADLTEAEKKKILAVELGKYKKLKSQLATTRAPAAATGPVPVPVAVRAAPAGPQPEILKAIEDLKRVVRQECQALREEIKQLRAKTGTGLRSSDRNR